MPKAALDATTMERPRRRRDAPLLWTVRVVFHGAAVCRQGARPLPPGRTVLGRGALAEWGLQDDPLLSRAHLALDRSGGALTLTDLGSRNGSRLDGRHLAPDRATVAADGALVRVGDTLLLLRQVRADLRPCPARGPLASVRGDAPATHALRADLRALGPQPVRALLLGESGVGKGLAAAALHEASGRRGPFVAVNCAAIPEQLAESALFGHRAGAFTGAERDHPGFFRAANGGTLFLDEIADLPLPLQPKLLHAVEAGAVTPVGGTRPVPVDVRLVAATSLDLTHAVAGGRFRGELLARLGEYQLRLPPLRERAEDVLAHFEDAAGGPPTADLAEALLLHRWPYNIREVQALAREARVRAGPDVAPDLGHVQARLVALEPGAAQEAPPAAAGPPDRAAASAALQEAEGNVAEAARCLGRSRRQLYRDLSRLGLDPAAFRPG